MHLRFERLTAQHPIAAFVCTNVAMTDYLRKFALTNQSNGLGHTHVALDPATGAIAGYFQVAPTSIHVADLPPEMTKGLPGYPIPCLLLARLARAEHLTGHGIGSDLLIQALRSAVAVENEIGFRYVVTDAIDPAAVTFYQKFGFELLPPTDGTVFPQRLVLTAKQVRATVAALDRRLRANASRHARGL